MSRRCFIQRHLESGHYENASEVLRDTLRALDHRDAMFAEWLGEEVKASMADKRPSVPADEMFRHLESRHPRRMKAAKRGA